jgi:TRAP-type C4-dicarboxylate transport system substrate-binding protein
MPVPSREVDLMPLSSVLELPGFIEGACVGSTKFNAIARPGGTLDKQELSKLGMRVLYTNMLPPYVLMTKDRAIRSLSDMEGVKLRASGAAVGDTMRALGAVPINIASSEIYESISRGTIDGAFFPTASIPPYSLEEEIKYITDGVALGAAASLVAISEDTWQGLSPEIQQAMLEAADTAQQNLCNWLDTSTDEIHQSMVNDHGIELIKIAPEDAAAWYDAIAGVVTDWVDQMNGLGYDGQAIVDAFRNADAG